MCNFQKKNLKFKHNLDLLEYNTMEGFWSKLVVVYLFRSFFVIYFTLNSKVLYSHLTLKFGKKSMKNRKTLSN